MALYLILFLFWIDRSDWITRRTSYKLTVTAESHSFYLSAFPHYQHIYVLFDPILLTVELIHYKNSNVGMIATCLLDSLDVPKIQFVKEKRFLRGCS